MYKAAAAVLINYILAVNLTNCMDVKKGESESILVVVSVCLASNIVKGMDFLYVYGCVVDILEHFSLFECA